VNKARALRWFTLICFLPLYGVVSAQPNFTSEQGARTKLVILGTGTPVPSSERYGPAVAIVVDDKAYVFDAGSGMVRRLHQARGMGMEQLDPLNIQQLFISHLHSDHILDYSEFVFDYWWHREKPIHTFGPPGLQALNDAAENMFAADIERRQFDGNGNFPDGYKVNVTEITEDGVVFEDDKISVTAFAVDHGSWEYAYGYRVETPDKVIVISGDTNFSQNLMTYSEGVDFLVHEIYSSAAIAEARRDGINTLHTSPENVALIANTVNPEVLVLYHLVFFNLPAESILEELARHYDGKVLMPADLTVIE
jgi:ribonuclease Z